MRRERPCARSVLSRIPRTGSATGGPRSARRQRLLLDVALLVVLGAPVARVHLDDVGHLLDARIDARPDPRLQVLRRLPVGLELPERSVGRIVGGEQRRPRGVVADADDLVEDALLELAVLPALADLVDGEHVHLPQGLEPFARREPVGKPVPDVREQEEELLVPPAHPLARRQLAEHRRQEVGLAGPGRPAEEQGPLPAGAGHVLVDESPRAGQRPLLGGAVDAVFGERAGDELGRQPQAGEQRQPARIGAAGAAAQDLVAALVARVEPPGPAADGAGVRALAGRGYRPAFPELKDETLAAAGGALGALYRRFVRH